MKRRKKKRSGRSIMILISSIVVLNMVGISYAYWNENLQILTSISMGNMDVHFCNDYIFEQTKGSGDLTVGSDDNNCTFIVEGTVEEEVQETVEETAEATILGAEYSDYKGSLNFDIVNQGSIPAELVKAEFNKCDNLNLQLDQQSYILQPQERFSSNSGKLQLPIEAGEGTYDFNIEFLYRQQIH